MLLYVRNCDEQEVMIDFQHVKFATRSFIDEFYNLFIKPSSAVPCHIEIINVPEKIEIGTIEEVGIKYLITYVDGTSDL